MLNLIRKRHADKSWAFFTELANSTGSNVRGFADAFAIGIWPSRGYEAHCYEVKISREDLKKELSDPAKADTVGKYADYFWLVVSDIKLIETLVIPERWGVLTPKGSGDAEVLRVVKKAPKQEAAPWPRSFCAAVIRHINDKHVTQAKYDALKTDLEKELRPRLQNELNYGAHQTERAHKELLAAVHKFREASGIDIISAQWMLGNIGEAARMIAAARFNYTAQNDFIRVAEGHERLAEEARKIAAVLTPAKPDPDPTPG